jgi:hypothetical protein
MEWVSGWDRVRWRGRKQSKWNLHNTHDSLVCLIVHTKDVSYHIYIQSDELRGRQ